MYYGRNKLLLLLYIYVSVWMEHEIGEALCLQILENLTEFFRKTNETVIWISSPLCL